MINPTVDAHSGRIVKLTGDGFLAEFPTVHEAVKCGIEMQQGFAESTLDFRVGINLGDIIDDGQDIHGEGVNIAARIEALAEPGGICIPPRAPDGAMFYDRVAAIGSPVSETGPAAIGRSETSFRRKRRPRNVSPDAVRSCR